MMHGQDVTAARPPPTAPDYDSDDDTISTWTTKPEVSSITNLQNWYQTHATPTPANTLSTNLNKNFDANTL
eukprot:3289620-Ditylum_brightwellii.AAC.1